MVRIDIALPKVKAQLGDAVCHLILYSDKNFAGDHKHIVLEAHR